MSASGSSGNKSKIRKNSSGCRSDPGWEHAIEIDNASKKVQCRYCEVVRSGGIFRLKHHLAGTNYNVEPCSKVPEDVKIKFKQILQKQVEESQKKRKVYVDLEDDGDLGTMKKQRENETIDCFARKTSQSKISHIFKKDAREKACQQIARFFYTSAIPFNCVKNPEFVKMIEMIGQHGPGMKPPSYNDIRVKYLKQEVERTVDIIEEYKLEWQKTGCTCCTIMSDGWSDRRRRSICNFMVNSPKGTVFLTSIDTSDISKTADKVLEMLNDIVEKVGEENVVQVVTDNASNYKLAGELLMEKRKVLYWTPCAAHCIDLMLEDFEKKIDLHKTTIASGRKITTYIFSRTLLHTWLIDFTKGKELIRPAVTRFATSYLTLGCLSENKGALMTMFTSNKWKCSRFAGSKEGKEVQKIVLDSRGFWSRVVMCLKAAFPLIKVLRMVDSDCPSMGFIYEYMDRAKEKIQQNFDNVRKRYGIIWDIIDERWASQLHRPLHAAAYYLNPHYHYSPTFKADAEVKIGFYNTLQRLVPNESDRVKIDIQMDDFKNAMGLFGLDSAKLTRTKKAPAEWWDSYGDQCPELKKFAIRVLSLTCSSSGCERNWSAFEMVHSKRRNRLHQKRMNDLVFVMYNLKLKERQEQRQSRMKEILFDFDDIQSDDEWITEKQDPVLPHKKGWLNVLNRRAQQETWSSDENEVHDVEIMASTLNETGALEDLTRNVDDIPNISDDEWNDDESDDDGGDGGGDGGDGGGDGGDATSDDELVDVRCAYKSIMDLY